MPEGFERSKKLVTSLEEMANAKALVIDAAKFAVEEVGRRHELGKSNEDQVKKAVYISISNYESTGDNVKIGDLRNFAYDAGEETLVALGYGDEQIIQEYRSELNAYMEEINNKQRAE